VQPEVFRCAQKGAPVSRGPYRIPIRLLRGTGRVTVSDRADSIIGHVAIASLRSVQVVGCGLGALS